MTQEEIHEKGFSLYNKIKVGTKEIEDAILNLESLKAARKESFTKTKIYEAMGREDLATCRRISRYYYNTNGIYKRVCKYFAYLYRYDWYTVPEIYDDEYAEEEKNRDKILTDFYKTLNFLDNSYIKQLCGNIALTAIIDGAYYGYRIMTPDSFIIQDLPADYCRSRYSVNGLPVVEFDMSFFDAMFTDVTYRMKILNLFPKEFRKGYLLYLQHKLPADEATQAYGKWFTLDPGASVKFSLGDRDMPLFINVIPDLIDLEAAKGLDLKMQMQKLLKIIVQKLPLDKNSDLVFDVDEAKDLHDNAVAMLKNALGVNVLTTFAEVDDIDVSNDTAQASSDALERNERSVYNSFGVSQNLFNGGGNIALTNSILNDESSMRTLLFSYNAFFNRVLKDMKISNRKKYNFRFYMLETTQYNYKDLSKMYKEQTQIGYSKMLPQIALGHSQSSILNSINFENKILSLSSIMIPPLMSSVMSGVEILNPNSDKKGESSTPKNEINIEQTKEDSSVGRPEKDESEKSDKTLANEQAQG